MPARDHSRALQEAFIAALRANSTISTMAGSRVYETIRIDAPWPYLRIGSMTVRPWEATGVSGGEISGLIHVHARGGDSGPARILNEAVWETLDEADLPLDTGGLLDLRIISSRVERDVNEPNGYQGIVEFYALTGE